MTLPSPSRFVWLLLVLPLAGQTAVEAPVLSESVTLASKVHRKWRFRLPEERWMEVGKAIDLSAGGGGRFAARLEGEVLRLDTDGDGELDARYDGDDGFAVLVRGDRRHALRLRRAASGWQHAPASSMSGRFGETSLRLIDQNGNGRFDDWGEDALIIGRGRVAGPLSPVVRIGDELHEIQPAADGGAIGISTYRGPRSWLSLKGEARGKVMSLVVVSRDGRHAFGMSATDAKVAVPAGEYALHSGSISLGGNTVRMQGAADRMVFCPAEGTGELRWGGPLRATFRHQRREAQLVFDPGQISFHGAFGETYTDWNPLGASPRISVFSKSGREIAQAYFPGNC